MYVFCSFIPFLLVFFAFHRKDFILLNLIGRYMTSTSDKFLKSKDIVDLCKVHVCISKLFIQCNTGSCCVHITGGVNIYLYVCKSIGFCFSCKYLSVCVISTQNTSKNHTIRVKPSVILMSCCIKHTARSSLY